MEISENRHKQNDITSEVHELDTKYSNISRILEYCIVEWKLSTILFLRFSMFSGGK